MARKNPTAQFLFCINNDAYPASLEVRKVYQSVPDSTAEARDFVRVIDESGDDYLYPKAMFISIELPRAAAKMVRSLSAGAA